MGVYGCVRVRWGAGGIRNTRTRQAGDINGVVGQDLGPMAGEISPDIMFWRIWRKVVRMGADRCRLVRMTADGCMGKEGSKNKATRTLNGKVGNVL